MNVQGDQFHSHVRSIASSSEMDHNGRVSTGCCHTSPCAAAQRHEEHLFKEKLIDALSNSVFNLRHLRKCGWLGAKRRDHVQAFLEVRCWLGSSTVIIKIHSNGFQLVKARSGKCCSSNAFEISKICRVGRSHSRPVALEEA